MTVSLLYVTAQNREAALAMCRTLVEERLVACANVLDGITSVYRWEGRIEQANEAVLLLKTRSELVERVIARVRELHRYEVPCVVSWPIDRGNPDYMKWIVGETVAEFSPDA